MSYSEINSKEFVEISNTIGQLMSQSQQNEKDYEKVKEMFQHLLLDGVQFIKSNKNSEQQKLKLQKSCKIFKVSRIALLHNLNLILETAENVSDEIVNKHLQKWRENQTLLENGDQSMDSEVLNKIQYWCENLAKVLWTTRNRLKMDPKYKEFLNDFDEGIPGFTQHIFEDVGNLLVWLVKHTVIIEKQPPQVLLPNEKFSSNIRLLVGDALNIEKINSSVKVSIVSEQQAESFQKLRKTTNLKCGKLKNCSGKIKFDKKSSNLIATFNEMKLNRNDFNNKVKSEENVPDEKFALLFQSKFSIGDEGLEIYIKALSMPIVVIVDSQRPASNAIISWNNVFPVYDQSIDKLKFLDSLPSKFCLKSIVCALSEKTLVAPKLALILEPFFISLNKFALTRFVIDKDDDAVICLDQFYEACLRGHKMKFMEWCYSAIELTQNNLCELWHLNYVIGFITAKSAGKLLLDCEPGTFLLRLSDCQKVAVIIDFCKLNENNEKCVLQIEPLTSIELKLRSLPDRILDHDDLKMLYQSTSPHINKEVAFGKFASHRVEQIPGYDSWKAQASLLTFSEIQLNSPIDPSISISTSIPVHTNPPIPTSSIDNYFIGCWSWMRNVREDNQYNLI